jgi:hypothetical protein
MSSAARNVARSASANHDAAPSLVVIVPTEPAPPPSEPKTRDPLAVLSFARELLGVPQRWLHGDRDHSSVDGHGAGCAPWDEAASRWDVWGALAAAHGTDQATDQALHLVARALGLHNSSDPGHDFLALATWNDAPERTHAEVLAALDDSIALAPRPLSADAGVVRSRAGVR